MVDSPGTRPSLLVRLRDPSDGSAWEEFLEIYTPLLRNLARRKGLQESDAADLTQDVFRAVARAIDRYEHDPARGSFRAWLFRIARNLIVNQLVARRRHPPGVGGDSAARLLEEHPAPAEEETALFLDEYRRRLFTWAAEQVRGEFRDADVAIVLDGRRRGPPREGGRPGPGVERGRRLSQQEPCDGPVEAKDRTGRRGPARRIMDPRLAWRDAR